MNNALKINHQYSLDRITAKTDLVNRGISELGLLKNENHFTIIYVCQFCGRLINYSSTPCIFCGNYPKTKREIIVSQALSSNSLDMSKLLVVSKAIKNKEDLELLILQLRQLIDDVIENENQYPIFRSLFSLLSNQLLPNMDFINRKAAEQLKRANIVCKKCNQPILFVKTSCIYCAIQEQRSGKSIESIKAIPNDLTKTEKWTVALNSFLLFVENHLDMGENEKKLEELIFVSIFIINLLVEKEKVPKWNLKRYWKKLLREVHYFGSYEMKGAVTINKNDVKATVDPERSSEGELTIMSLGSNLTYLLQS